MKKQNYKSIKNSRCLFDWPGNKSINVIWDFNWCIDISYELGKSDFF